MKIKITVLFLLFRLNAFCQDLPLNNYEEKLLLMCNKGQTKEEIIFPDAKLQLSPTANIFNNNNLKAFIFPLRDENVTSFIKKSEIIIGGKIQNGNLYVAASGNNPNISDFVPGPLNLDGDIEADACTNWDRIFTVTKEEILQHEENFKKGLYKDDNNLDIMPPSIKYWPGYGNPFWNEKYDFALSYNGNLYNLANFIDTNADGFYDPSEGDIPSLDYNCEISEPNFTSISFWVMNDVGSNHALSKGESIKMQFNCYAYNYAEDDNHNAKTSFMFKLINFSIQDILDFHIAFRYDFDLGCPFDDNIGIDTFQNLMYVYNDGIEDGSEQSGCSISNNGYSPYVIGLQYLGGIRNPKVFAYDNDGNKLYDDFGNPILSEPLIDSDQIDTLIECDITSFIVKEACKQILNCDFNNGDEAYYNLLKGKKVDGQNYTHDGKVINHMFPNNPASSAWSMCNDLNLDNRDIEAMMSVGPILLQPGAINKFNFSFHLINNSTYCPDVTPLVVAANRSKENFFDRCFYTKQSYPLSPSLDFTHNSDLDIAVTLPDDENNEQMKAYSELFYSDPKGYDTGVTDLYGEFEGVMIYQLKDSMDFLNVTMGDENKMRLIHQSDLTNNVVEAYNFFTVPDPKPYNLNNKKWIRKLMVNGQNNGLSNSFLFKDDLFEDGNGLIKDKTYWFAAYSYAFNNWKELDTFNGYGQHTQFWSGVPAIYKFVNTKVVNTNNENIFLPTATCNNNSINILNFENNLNMKIYDITGKLIISQKISENNIQLHNDLKNTLLVIDLEDTVTHQRSINKVFCTE